MANEDDGAAWHRETAERIGKAVAARRKELGMTAQQLSERCRHLGAPIHRSTITKIENGRPRFDLGELIILASALVTSPVVLVYPGPYNEEIDGVPVHRESQFELAQWFSALDDAGDDAAHDVGISELKAARALVDGAVASKAREVTSELVDRVTQLVERVQALEAEAGQARFIKEHRRSTDSA